MIFHDPRHTNGPNARARRSRSFSRNEGLERLQGRPLPASIEGEMESRFGRDFSAVRLYEGSQATAAARDLRAWAYTLGSDVVWSADAPPRESPVGRALLAHELAHVVQQSGGPDPVAGAPMSSDASAEREARVAAGSVMQNAGPPRLTTGSPARIQAYQVEGPWNWNDPVHEVLTLTALRDALEDLSRRHRAAGSLLGGVKTSKFPERESAEGHNIEPKKIDETAQQFIRGVVWPDDPKGYLFKEPKGTTQYSTAYMWGKEYDAKKKDDPAALIARSHYGDLQFFHGMATREAEAPAETKRKILEWGRFLSDVAAGRISGDRRLDQMELTKKLFPANQKYTVKQLLGYAGATDVEVRQRAAGTLMHLIQDSFAAGHVQRKDGSGMVEEFHDYTQQMESLHSERDAWAEGKTLGERIRATPGAEPALKHSVQVLLMLDSGASTDDVVDYLDRKVFELSSKATPAGAGKEFAKPKLEKEPRGPKL